MLIIELFLSGDWKKGMENIWLQQFPIGADDLFGRLSFFTGGKQGRAGISIPRAKPETVHKIIVRAKRRQFFGGSTANKDGRENGFGKDIPAPYGKTCAGFRFIENQDKKD